MKDEPQLMKDYETAAAEPGLPQPARLTSLPDKQLAFFRGEITEMGSEGVKRMQRERGSEEMQRRDRVMEEIRLEPPLFLQSKEQGDRGSDSSDWPLGRTWPIRRPQFGAIQEPGAAQSASSQNPLCAWSHRGEEQRVGEADCRRRHRPPHGTRIHRSHPLGSLGAEEEQESGCARIRVI
ncbi:hypothetical protein FQA47_013687 [Oryzias melastigma]|uniref:Uncharacterized protein n=1 Tax=Oryzias melastigma TaxID=30732 RepID=A0A834F2R3_ORYME|nr:hypothetical protein FQA47_013687 [Oryzias melastigma]